MVHKCNLVEDWCAQAENAKIAGVYAVFDADSRPQYVGTRGTRGFSR